MENSLTYVVSQSFSLVIVVSVYTPFFFVRLINTVGAASRRLSPALFSEKMRAQLSLSQWTVPNKAPGLQPSRKLKASAHRPSRLHTSNTDSDCCDNTDTGRCDTSHLAAILPVVRRHPPVSVRSLWWAICTSTESCVLNVRSTL